MSALDARWPLPTAPAVSIDRVRFAEAAARALVYDVAASPGFCCPDACAFPTDVAVTAARALCSASPIDRALVLRVLAGEGEGAATLLASLVSMLLTRGFETMRTPGVYLDGVAAAVGLAPQSVVRR